MGGLAWWKSGGRCGSGVLRMTNLWVSTLIARILFLGVTLGSGVLGILLAFFVLLFLEGGIDLVLRAWKEEVSAEGYKLKGVVAVIVGGLTGGYSVNG